MEPPDSKQIPRESGSTPGSVGTRKPAGNFESLPPLRPWAQMSRFPVFGTSSLPPFGRRDGSTFPIISIAGRIFGELWPSTPEKLLRMRNLSYAAIRFSFSGPPFAVPAHFPLLFSISLTLFLRRPSVRADLKKERGSISFRILYTNVFAVRNGAN